MKRFEETASTSTDEFPPATDEPAGTQLLADFSAARQARPGLVLAGLVLVAAMTSGGTLGPVSIEATRRRDDLATESGTGDVDVNPELLEEVKRLFEEGAVEFFQDGLHSPFSRTLLNTVALHRDQALRAISHYVSSGSPGPDVVSEALRWLADFNDPETFNQRWALLQQTIRNRSARVRDGAILGFGALDDPRARHLLLEAQASEHVAELRQLIAQVVAQLERPR
jgi:hypothetical protein